MPQQELRYYYQPNGLRKTEEKANWNGDDLNIKKLKSLCVEGWISHKVDKKGIGSMHQGIKLQIWILNIKQIILVEKCSNKIWEYDGKIIITKLKENPYNKLELLKKENQYTKISYLQFKQLLLYDFINKCHNKQNIYSSDLNEKCCMKYQIPLKPTYTLQNCDWAELLLLKLENQQLYSREQQLFKNNILIKKQYRQLLEKHLQSIKKYSKLQQQNCILVDLNKKLLKNLDQQDEKVRELESNFEDKILQFQQSMKKSFTKIKQLSYQRQLNYESHKEQFKTEINLLEQSKQSFELNRNQISHQELMSFTGKDRFNEITTYHDLKSPKKEAILPNEKRQSQKAFNQ